MRIVALDLIRFFAALSVVLYHYISRPESNAYPLIREVTNYGYLGVPLFFIISGYVIALSANNRTALQFGVSRFVRLYPALWAGVIFTVLTLFIIVDKQHSVAQVLANFTLLNEYLGFEDIDGVYWTLKAELKFYACVFLLLIFGVFQKYYIWLSVWLALAIMHTAFGQPFFMGWFISPAYSSFFIAGVAFFLIQNYGKNAFNLIVLISSLVVSSFTAYGQADGFMVDANVMDKSISVVIVWFFYCLMYFLSIGKINLKERNVLITLGALTYPLYLIHNMAGKALIDKYSSIIPEQLLLVIVIGIMIFASWIIHLVIEKPLATPLKNYLLAIFDSNKSLTKKAS
jgi:peptidoglycan/LPS O-acetylase OafA/YrhL